MSQSPTPWCTDHVLPGLAYDGADGRYGNTATAIGSDSEKKLSSERHGKVIIYPFCWVYHLDLGSISHIDPRSSTLTRTEHFQWQNQVVRILHCITLKVNGFVTEKTCPQERLGPQSWEIMLAGEECICPAWNVLNYSRITKADMKGGKNRLRKKE